MSIIGVELWFCGSFSPNSLGYINEDLPYGLAPWSFIGRMWGIPTPAIDAVIRIASTMVDRDYYSEGLTAEDLGIAGLQPEDVKNLLG